VSAHVALDLAEQRGSFDSDVRLLPIDAEGNRVADLTLEPQTVHVTVNIRQRDDVREVPVRPDFVLDSLPEGYVLTSISYDPQNILIGVVSGQVDRIPDTLLTDPIDLTNQTGDFDLTVPVRLADDDLLVLGGQHITVSVRINALTSTRQFTNIRVDLIGLPTEIEAQLVPDEVTALITGPQPVLEKLIAADVQVLVDLNGLQAGRL
jgi:YbbR domain-containing protein